MLIWNDRDTCAVIIPPVMDGCRKERDAMG